VSKLGSGESKNAILDALVTKLKEIDEFEEHVFKGYRKHLPYNRSILVHLRRDVIAPESTAENLHNLEFNLLVRVKADIQSNAEVEIESFISLVGLVEDKLDENSYNPGVWEDLAVNQIIYTFGAAETFVYYNAMIRLTIKAQW